MKTQTIIGFVIGLVVVTLLALSPVARVSAYTHLTRATAGPTVSTRIDALLKRAAGEKRFSGTVLVQRQGKALLRKGYGMTDGAWHVENTPQTRFLLPGLTQLMSAVAIEQLAEHGKLSLQDSVCKYLSTCPASWRPVTIRELLNRTSGIPAPDGPRAASDGRTVAEYLAAAARRPFSFKPGTRVEQGTAGYVALLPIIERASGESYSTYLRQHMFEPLRLAHTAVGEWPTGTAQLATSSTNSNDRWTLAVDGVSSTVDDLNRWDEAVMGCGMVSPQALLWALQPGWQLGGISRGHQVIQATGTWDGAAAGERLFPSDEATIIVLADRGGDVRYLLDEIQTMLFGR